MLFRVASVLICLTVGSNLLHAADKPVVVEHSKPVPPSSDGSLGTTFYGPTETEKLIIKDWTEDQLASGSPKVESLKGPDGRRVGWFGIVRNVTEDKAKQETQLLVEMKYFDGLTDLHLQVVAIEGAGDFQVVIPGIDHKVKNLSLIKVDGKVKGEADGKPLVTADYARVWDWGQFTFMSYGKDKTNPEWVKLRKVAVDKIYSSRPTPQFYEQRLGKRVAAEKPKS
jgi:hypothetical protein